MSEKKMVVVTTEYRGVFVGELAGRSEREVTLANARCAIVWGTTGGWGELAATGPTSQTKLGARFPRLVLVGMTAIAEMSPAAVAAFEASP